MSHDRFVYVTYIRTTPETLWDALTQPAFHRQYWFGMHIESDWAVGSPWRLLFEDGRAADAGEILEADPPRRLVISWRNEFRPELTAEGFARASFEIEAVDGSVKLTVVHEMERTGSKLIEAVSGGWPRILSSLKSLLETGEPMNRGEPLRAA
ncbi:MAG TPA: SRPBCC family protein [Caulobacteraceae bacterium]